MIGRQVRLFLCALQMLTRLPIPRLSGFEGEWIARSARYYPVVGWIVGGLCAVVLLGANRIWPEPVAAILAVATGLLVTGGFHEDGLADTVDGFGGGHTPQQRLDIMKDSRNGSCAALALWVVLTLKAAVLATLSPAKAALALVLIHGAARALPVMVMTMLRYAGDHETAKLKSAPLRVRSVEAVAALVLGLAPLPLLLPLGSAIQSVGLAALSAIGLAWVARRLIGGFTGDVLGAVEQLAEVALLLGISVRIAAS